MDSKLRKEKLKMWKDNLKQLEKELEAILVKQGQVVQGGNLPEDSAYRLATEEAETTRARIEEVKKIIADLEEGK